MKDQTSDYWRGYRLTIIYDSKFDRYLLTGYSWRLNKFNITESSQDGATLEFDSLEKALDHLRNYNEESKNTK